VLSSSLSFSTLIYENTFVSGYRFTKHILQVIPKMWFSVCTRSVPQCQDEEVSFGHHDRPSR
jgi:hypothetical protein